MGAKVMNNCRYTEGVGCDSASDAKCARCGWNPAVRKVRVAKIKNDLKSEIIFAKKARGAFAYYAPRSAKEG